MYSLNMFMFWLASLVPVNEFYAALSLFGVSFALLKTVTCSDPSKKECIILESITRSLRTIEVI